MTKIHYIARDRQGRFARAKQKIKRYFIYFLVIGTLAALYEAYQWHQTSITYLREHGITSTVEALAGDTNEAVEVLAGRLLTEKLETLQYEIVDSLAADCETKGVAEPDAAIIFDSNNEPSLGAWQFQRKTVIHYYKKLYDQEINRTEAINIAIDHEKARTLTKEILFTEKDGWKNWLNCGKRLGLAEQITLINRLSN